MDTMVHDKALLRILVFKHMPSQNPGIFRSFAREHNVEFSEIDLHAGDAVPDLSRFDGLWVMGGSMNVWEEDRYPWLVAEKVAIRRAVEELEIPFLGFCFGHQLLAEATGGKVDRSVRHEFGVFEITPTPEGTNHPFMQDLPASPGWINAHLAEISQPPPGAVVLASSERCDNHVMTLNERTFSCQFHAEVCETTLGDWLQIPGIVDLLLDLLGEEGLARFKDDVEGHRTASNAGARKLFENWLKLVRKSRSGNELLDLAV
jgi:GMP synthase-like glutamine amidotransferase